MKPWRRISFAELDLDNHTMHIPSGSDWRGGYTDRHLVVSRNDVLAALDILPPFLSEPFDQALLLNYIEKVKHKKGVKKITRKWGTNPEKILKNTWTQKGLNVHHHERTMFTCAIKKDTTRWKEAEQPAPNIPGLLLKYPEEHAMAEQVCASRVKSTKTTNR